MAEAAAGAGKEQKQKKPLNVGLILQIVFAIFNLSVTGYGAYMVYASTLGWNPPTISDEELFKDLASTAPNIENSFIYTMDKFTVNLGGEPKRTIRLEVNLEMMGREGFEELIDTQNRGRVRDRIVRILNDKTFSDLEPVQGKLFLKEKISDEVNSILKKGVVKDVFFSDFVVQ